MKKILILILCGLLGCSREDYLKEKRPFGTLLFQSFSSPTGQFNNNLLIDSLKYPLNRAWVKTIEFQSVERLHAIEVRNGVELLSHIEISPSQLRYEISIPISSLGQQNFWIDVIDWSENREVIRLNLNVFDNLPPMAQLEYNQAQKMIDFSKSYDLDERFGGGIFEYRVYVNGILRKQDEVSNFSTTINNGFRMGSSYQVRLEVIDRDGAVSGKEMNVVVNN